MKTKLKEFIWKFTRATRLDYVIARFFSNNLYIANAIPRAKSYCTEKINFPIASNLKLWIDRSDYTQWRVFAGLITVNEIITKNLNKYPRIQIADIGANIGAYSALLVKAIKRKPVEIHLFEPNPKVFDTLEKNIESLQQYRPDITCHTNQLAVGERSDTLKLNIPSSHSGASTLVDSEDQSEQVEVQVVPFDSYVDNHHISSLQFIKIDVESFEPAVFHGAIKTIKTFLPILYFEYSKDWYKHFTEEYVDEVFEVIRECGYSLYLETKYYSITPLEFRKTKELSYGNIFALRPEHF